ncbi:MAG: hypothetical protein V3W10_09860, partial [candidate division NC10 bacterium]
LRPPAEALLFLLSPICRLWLVTPGRRCHRQPDRQLLFSLLDFFLSWQLRILPVPMVEGG